MRDTQNFSFGGGSVATSYDNGLVPLLFDPWASKLVDGLSSLAGSRVLDLATGTGIVAQYLAREVGAAGKVLAADISTDMLDLAKRRCASAGEIVSFIECSADALRCPDESVDLVTCQQGFQFFPDRDLSAREIYRVLRPEGSVVVTTWRPVTECRYFGTICLALEAMDRPDLAEKMRIPFDHMPTLDLIGHFVRAGFVEVEVGRHVMPLVMERGPSEAVETAYSTPVGQDLRGMSDADQSRFRKLMAGFASELARDGRTMGHMSSDVLTATKPG